MRRTTKIAAALTAGAFALSMAACGSSDSSPTASDTTSSGASKSDVKVGTAYDIGGRGDKSFNDMAAAGLDKAKAEFGVSVSESEAAPDEADSAKEDRLVQLADRV